MTRPPVQPLELRQATINAHGGVMSFDTAEKWGPWLADQAKDLDVIYLQEVTNRVARTAREFLGKGWDLERRIDRPGQGETATAVRRSAGTVQRSRSHPMGGGRWIGRFTGRLHTARHLLEVIVDLDVCVIALGNIFAPPGVDVTPAGIRGKDDRVAAWRRYWRRFRRWGNGLNRAGILWATGGDLQDPRRARGTTSPHDTAQRVGGNVYLRGIDGFLVGPGLTVRDVETIEPGPGMDHHGVKGVLVIRPGRLS